MKLSPLLLAGFLLAATSVAEEAASNARFFRGLNLNGPAVTIDGNEWEGQEAKWYETAGGAFENQKVELKPATDEARAKMIRSSRWGKQFDLSLRDIPPGNYSLYAYVWEDNDSQDYRIVVNRRTVVEKHTSGPGGTWHRLGPWHVLPEQGVIRIQSEGGDANFSGIELWQKPAATPEGLAFFEKRIRPLLVKHCYECHSAESKTAEGSLLVDSAPGLLNGGDRGPAVVPGDLDHSLLVKAIRYDDENLQMPPDGKLSSQDIADLEEWIRLGAPDPRSSATVSRISKIDWEKGAKHWSYQPVKRPDIPPVKNTQWPRGDIDRFLLARLEKEGLAPLGDADKRTLIRRATFDLTGLPPTPEEVEAFLADTSDDAFAKVVDRLLGSEHYGERWGRHWLDLVRYADTAGDNSDYPVPQLYLYRNWVIDSLNADKPYDQFVREQIAGDLLPVDTDEERNQQTIATGYLAMSRRFGSIIKNYPQHLTIEDTIDNLGRTFLGHTINCARCHDHKFDAISQEDYYGLYGIFESTRYPFPGIELDKKPRDLVKLASDAGLAYAMAEGKPENTRLQRRGEPKNLGDEVPRKFLQILGEQTLEGDAAKTSGRLQLAQWLTDPKNPLIARVMVNRVWHYHFGAGIVRTPSDFGVRGLPPGHPELLDYLADEFIANGWSLKKLHRQIMLSHAYQLSSGDDAQALAVDPSNTLHWRFGRRRLSAEEIRDSMLMISGKLETGIPRQSHPFPPSDKWSFTQHYPFKDFYPSNRRSVFLLQRRLNALPFFVTFDGADANASTPMRDSSVTTVQSLYLLNDPFVHEQAGGLAERLITERPDETSRIERGFQLVLNRPPTDNERTAASQFLAQSREQLASTGVSEGERERRAMEALARVLFRINEFLYVD